MSETLTAQSVTRRYGDRVVLENISLSLPPHQITALLGGSGAGKSTLLRLLAGLEPLDEGRITLGHTLLSEPGLTLPAEKRRIGLIFQDFALFPHLTAARNVAFGLKHLPREQAEAQVTDWLARLGLQHRANAYPHELSGGEQQRVAIARALAPKPSAILMDEPFSGLDPSLRDSVREAALEAVRAAGIPALLVTHDPAEALEHADRIAILAEGKLLQSGTAEDVYYRPENLTVARALGPVNHFLRDAAPEDLVRDYPSGSQIIVRPEGIALDASFPVKAHIRSVRLTGALTRLTLETQQLKLTALIPGRTDLHAGDETGIRLIPGLTVCYPHQNA